MWANSNACRSNRGKTGRGPFCPPILNRVKYIPTKSSDRVSIDRTDNDKDYLYFLFDDVDGHIEQNDLIKYLVFASAGKNKEVQKNYKKALGRN